MLASLGSSCADALLYLQKRILEYAGALGRREPLRVAVTSLDVGRAFDSAPFAAIVKSLLDLGAPEWLARVVLAWLRGRSQFVEVDGARSRPFPVASGTPQGAATSPTLYAALTRAGLDLPFHPGATVITFADDTLLARVIRKDHEEEDLAKSQADADLYTGFLASRGLVVNGGKTYRMMLWMGATPGSVSRPLLVGGVAVKEVEELRYLGILWDRRSNFTAHWSRVAASAKAAIAAIGSLVQWHGPALRHLVKERVIPLLLYSLLPCPPSNASTWEVVERIIRFCARRILRVGREESGEQLLTRAGLYSAGFLAARADILYMRSCVVGGRRLGDFLELGSHPRLDAATAGPYVGARRQVEPPAPVPLSARPFLVQPAPSNRYEGLNLPFARKIALWNDFVLHLGARAAEVIGSRTELGFNIINFFADRPTLLRLSGD